MASWKVGTHNRLTFPKAGSLQGQYYISGEKIQQYPTKDMRTKAGKTARMYVVPLDELETLEYKEDIVKTALELFPD